MKESGGAKSRTGVRRSQEWTALGVHFLSGGDGRTHICLTTVELVAGLAASQDARVQSALIALLLARPAYAEGVMAALGQ